MSIKRYGTPTKPGALPFSKAAGADGWLFVCGQVPRDADGEIVTGNITVQARAVRRPVGVRRLLGESLTYPLCVFQIIPVPITKVLGEGGVGFEEGATFLQKGSPFLPQVSSLFFF